MTTIQPPQPAAPFPPERCRGARCERKEARGPKCGRAATQVIFWREPPRKYSPMCGKHGVASLDKERRRLVLCVHPIEPAITTSGKLIEDGQGRAP